MIEIVPHLSISIASALIFAGGFFVWTKVEVAKIKKDLYYHKEIYDRDRGKMAKSFERVYSELHKMSVCQGEMKSDLKLIKFQVQNNHK